MKPIFLSGVSSSGIDGFAGELQLPDGVTDGAVFRSK
jgi:hypothetical protein